MSRDFDESLGRFGRMVHSDTLLDDYTLTIIIVISVRMSKQKLAVSALLIHWDAYEENGAGARCMDAMRTPFQRDGFALLKGLRSTRIVASNDDEKAAISRFCLTFGHFL